MKPIVCMLISIFVSASVFAQNDIQQSLLKQLKQNVEKSCQNADFLDCVSINESTCHAVSKDQLEKISSIIETHSQAVAEHQFTEILKLIKSARNEILEENNIDVNKANACGKEFLTS